MTALQTVNLGTPPKAEDGDTYRVANVKANANVAVLNTQATLTSSSPNAVRDLAAADMGKRVNFTPTAPSTVRFPAANTTGADQIVSVHNLATAYDITMAIAAGSGDTAPAIVVVKPGEMLTYETDGVSVWRTIGRKKAFDEAVQGKLTVAGAASVASLSVGTNASISAAGAYSGVSANYSGAVSVGGPLGVTGQATFALRPAFNGNTPWDSGNLASPCTLDTAQIIAGIKTFSSSPIVPDATTAKQAVALGQFLASRTANGSVKIPTTNGAIIIQWGRASTSTAGSSVTFPTPFTTLFCLVATADTVGIPANAYVAVQNFNASTFNISSNIASVYANWIAIGV